jgi:hypothetical protein
MIRQITPISKTVNKLVTPGTPSTQNIQNAQKKRQLSRNSQSLSRNSQSISSNGQPLKRRLIFQPKAQNGGKNDIYYKKYIENLYIYDNHHDFHGNSRGDKALPSELLLINSKKIKNNLSTTEKTFFIKALEDLTDDNPSLFMNYYFIMNNKPDTVFSNKGNQIKHITEEDFKKFLNNELNFVNSKIIYDGNVANLSGSLKRIRNIINEEYKKEITAEIIFDPMNTKKADFNVMSKKLNIEENLNKFTALTNKVFNEGNDITSAFNDNTRKFFNIIYFKRKDNKNSIGLLFINKNRKIYNEIRNNNIKPNLFLKFLIKDVLGNYVENSVLNNNSYIVFDLGFMHISGGDNNLINSVKNIKDIIYHIYNNKIDDISKISFKYYIIKYLYQEKNEKEQAINILFDLKKAGDYGKVLLCYYNNTLNDKKDYNNYLLSTNDTLCALNAILRKNINIVFGTTENGNKNLCLYSCCNNIYNIQYVKNILEYTFKYKIDIDNIDLNAKINSKYEGKIINYLILKIRTNTNDKYKDKFIDITPKEKNILLGKLNKIIDTFIEELNNITILNKYEIKHKEIFNKYINKLSDLITIYDTIILEKDKIIASLNRYITLLNNPIRQIQILIPKVSDREGVKRDLRTLNNYLRRNDKDVNFRVKAISSYYIIKSRDIIKYINNLILLLNIYINKLIKNEAEYSDINKIIYSLYLNNIKEINEKIFNIELPKYNNNTLIVYLNEIINIFRDYLISIYNTSNKQEDKIVLTLVLNSLEYFENDFNKISTNIKYIYDKINKNTYTIQLETDEMKNKDNDLRGIINKNTLSISQPKLSSKRKRQASNSPPIPIPSSKKRGLMLTEAQKAMKNNTFITKKNT